MIRILALILVFAPILSGATYYVDPTGSDSNDGAIGTPWKTLPYACSQLTSGDTLYLRTGTYNEKGDLPTPNVINPYAFVALTQNTDADEEADRITIAAYPKETPIVSSVQPLTFTQCLSDDAGLTVGGVTNPNYADIYWAEFTADQCSVKEDANGYLSHVWAFEDGQFMVLCANTTQTSAIIDDSTWYTVTAGTSGQAAKLFDTVNLDKANDYWNDATVMVLDNGNTIQVRTIADSTQSDKSITFGPFLTASAPITMNLTDTTTYTIRNHPHLLTSAGHYYYTPRKDGSNKFKLYVWPTNPANLKGKIGIAKWTEAFWFQGSGSTHTRSYFTFDGMEIVGFGFSASTSTLGYNHITYSNCNLHDIPQVGIGVGNSDLLIDTCKIYRVSDYMTPLINGRPTSIGGGGSTNIVIKDNDFQYANRSTIWTTGVDGIQITGNNIVLSGTHAQAISLYATSGGVGCSNALIAHNTIKMEKFIPISTNTLGKCVIFGNLIYAVTDTLRQGIVSWATGVDELYIINNTIVATSSLGAQKQCYLDIATDANTYVHNNIMGGGNAFATGHTATHTYNYHTAKVWNQSAYQFGELRWNEYTPNKIYSDVFTDPDLSLDFSLTSNSPARNSGTPIAALVTGYGIDTLFPTYDFTKDIAGSSWDLTNPSMGCYEYNPDLDNHYPIITPIGNTSTTPGSAITPIIVSADDPDNDDLTWDVIGLPIGLTWTSETKTISGAINFPGLFTITVTVTDDGAGSLSTTDSFTIEVSTGTYYYGGSFRSN